MDAVEVQRAAAVLGEARRVVVFTGAGMSAESGVPTFRDDLTGLWARFDAEQLATPEAFHADPDLVWFGEALSEAALTAAVEAAASCDVLLTVGTSGVVYPAAEIPRVAARVGATVIQINPEPTPLDRVATLNLRGPAATVLPALVALAWAPPSA
ncbi:NAD-dependent deacetylase [Dactylosporangium sp. NPDC048998]|uniref:SIR2 family NAD-dependent protein deacylase n=1 Tax=Dactylosporangium sp. NPDC048998 TaxID=3363976 RepID=UPI0037162968